MNWNVFEDAQHGPIGRWKNFERQDKDEVHTVPINDIMEHLLDDCPCGPTVEVLKRIDGSVGYHITHHSLDGREVEEEKEL